MIVTAVRIKREDDVRRDVVDDASNRRFDLQHVDVREGARVIAPLTLTTGGVVEAQQHWSIDAKAAARESQFFATQSAKVVDRADRWVRLACLAVGGAGERDANALLTEMQQRSAMAMRRTPSNGLRSRRTK